MGAGLRRWVVRPGEGRGEGQADGSLGAVLARLAPDDAAALREGRVFVGRTRAGAATHVRPGDVVTVHAPRAQAATHHNHTNGSTTTGAVTIALDTDGVVAAIKPAGLPTIADHRGNDALVERAAKLLGCRADALHPTSRLDVGVSGVVLLARTDEARARLARARDEGTYRRRYVALACGAPSPATGRWAAPIGRAADPRLRAVGGRDTVDAATRYRTAAHAPGGLVMLSVEPETGRTHQIRLHAAHAGAPLLGDVDYGGPARLALPGGAVRRVGRVALHCAWVEAPIRTIGSPRVEAPVPDELRALWQAAGGDADAWAEALA